MVSEDKHVEKFGASDALGRRERHKQQASEDHVTRRTGHAHNSSGCSRLVRLKVVHVMCDHVHRGPEDDEPADDALGLALRRPGEGALRVRTGARSANFAERDTPGKERLELNGTELRSVESLASLSTF